MLHNGRCPTPQCATGHGPALSQGSTVIGGVALEQGILMGAGAIAGISAGLAAGTLFLPLFQPAFTGPDAPPFLVIVPGGALWQVAAMLGVLFAATVTLLLTLLRRLHLGGRGAVVAAAGGVGLGGCAPPLMGRRASDGALRRVALLQPAGADAGRAVAEATTRRLRADGLRVDILDWGQASGAHGLDATRHHALVLPDARTFPSSATANLLRYLLPAAAEGTPPGSLVAIGGRSSPSRWSTPAGPGCPLPRPVSRPRPRVIR